MSVITIENLKYRYPNTDRLALDGITLSIEKGEFIGIVGRNGAGKSTLSQAIIGLVPQFYKGAYGGVVRVNDIVAEKKPVEEMCEHVGLIFQNPFNQLSGATETVYAEVAYGLQNLGVPREEIKKRVEETLKALDIWQYRDRNPFDLSGGQMQRVAIASILVMRPDVIILDEPTSQLDPQGTEEVFRVVDQLSQTGITIIMIEQKLEKMAHYCDRLILMNDGKVVDFDTPEKIFSRDDLESMGVQAPAFTRICKENGISFPDGTFPAKLEDAVELMKKLDGKLTDGKLTDRKSIDGKSADGKITDREKTNKKITVTVSHKISPEGELKARMAEKIFTVKDMSFSYLPKVPIFEKLNLTLDRRTTAIIGQNGAGKTTLVRLLKGLLKPVSGSIFFGKEDISGKTVAMLADKVGYVFQNPDDQIFKYKVLDEVMFGPLNIGMDEATAKAKSLAALEMMGLKGREGENPYDLDLHERKMTAIASVIAMDTDVIILDEPTIAQDSTGRALIGDMIETLSAQGKLVIAILHDMDFVSDNFERVIVMAHGRILADGTAEEVFAKGEVLKEARLQRPYMMQLRELLER